MIDVEVPDNPARKILLLDKHADYIEAFEKNKDDFVRTLLGFSLIPSPQSRQSDRGSSLVPSPYQS